MPRKVDFRKFENNGEFGYAVEVYCRDETSLLKTQIFSAMEDKGHFLLRAYELIPRFLDTSSRPKFDGVRVEHDRRTTEAILYTQAQECFWNFKRNYAFAEDC